MEKKRSNPNTALQTWEKNAKLRNDTYDDNGYHGERDTTLVAPGSNPLKRDALVEASNIFTIIFLESLKVNFLGNVARWQQVNPSTKSGSTTAFEVENRKPGYGAMLALAPTITYRQKAITYQIGQWRMSLPFDQFAIEYQDVQTLALLTMGMKQIYNIFEAEMNNSVLAAIRVAYMRQFKSPREWLQETLQYAGLLNEKGFTGNELVSLYKNIQPNQNMRLLLATSETGFTALNLPPVTNNTLETPMDPSNLLSIMTQSLRASGSRRTVGNLDIYGIPHYIDAQNARILQHAENIDMTYHVYGVIMEKSVPAKTEYILIPSMSGLWYRLDLTNKGTNDPKSITIYYTNSPIKIRGSDLMTGPLIAGKPLFDGKYYGTKSIQNFDQETGSANILTMTGWGGAVVLPDQVSIGGAAYILSANTESKDFSTGEYKSISTLIFDEKRHTLFNMSEIKDIGDKFSDATMRAGEWESMFETNSVHADQDYGVGALLPFIAVGTDEKVRTWIPGHPMFERLAICPHTSRIGDSLNKEIPTHNEFIAGINSIGPVTTLTTPPPATTF